MTATSELGQDKNKSVIVYNVYIFSFYFTFLGLVNMGFYYLIQIKMID